MVTSQDIFSDDQRRSSLHVATTLLLVAAAIVLASGTATLYTDDSALRKLLDNVHWTVAFGAAAAIAWLGVRNQTSVDVRSQRWFAWALTINAAGQVLWVVQVASGWNPFPGPSDVMFLTMGTLFSVGLLDWLRRSVAAKQFRTALLDITGLVVAVLAMTLALYLPRRGDTSLLPMFFLVMYPALLGGAACIALIVTLVVAPALRLGGILFLGALLINSGLWLAWNARALDGTLQDGGLFNLSFSLVALTQGMGVLLWRRGPSSANWREACATTLRLLPIVIVILAATAITLAHTLPDVPKSMQWSSLLGGLVVLVLAVTRQSILLTERERVIGLERSLRSREQEYHMLVEQAADGIFVADQSGRYVEVNSAGAAMLGMTREQVLQRCIADVVPPEELHRVPGEIEQLRRGATQRQPWRMKRLDGSLFDAEVTGKMLPDGRIQGIVRNVSDRKMLEEQLRQAQKLEAIGTLAAGIAHDFNNLLMAIRGFTDIAAEDAGPGHRAQSSLAQIRKASDRAADLVRQIMAFSRPDKSVVQQLHLPEAIEEAFRLLRATLPAGVELISHCQADAPAISADPAQIQQVLLNLITNSWQALKRPVGRIEVMVTRVVVEHTTGLNVAAGVYACLTVRDNGEGMDEATRERIFEPFFTTKSTGEGCGLGLAMVHSIVRNHAGAIVVDSAPGVGTTFRIYFPQATGVQDEYNAELHDKPVTHSGLRVFYVDDEQSLVTMISTQLGRRGHIVTGFSDSMVALDTIRANPCAFDVLVTDQNMPNMSGVALLSAVRSMGINAPCILTSGYFDTQLHDAIQALDTVRMEQKPLSIEDLCAAIEQLVGQAQPVPNRDTAVLID